MSNKKDNKKKVLTTYAVEKIFVECLTNDYNPNKIECTPVTYRCVFDKSKIEENKDKILELLMNLRKEFRQSEGGGYSFLAACDNIDGDQWTGKHLTMEKLFALGIAANLVDTLVPREMWNALPGGMPYFIIKNV